MTDRKQDVMVDIRVGDFNFVFDNRKNFIAKKHKSPSQIKRDIDRQVEFKNKCVDAKPKEAFEEETIKIEQGTVSTQTSYATYEETETQTEGSSSEVETQTEMEDDTPEHENWKYQNLNWDSIVRQVTLSKIYR